MAVSGGCLSQIQNACHPYHHTYPYEGFTWRSVPGRSKRHLRIGCLKRDQEIYHQSGQSPASLSSLVIYASMGGVTWSKPNCLANRFGKYGSIQNLDPSLHGSKQHWMAIANPDSNKEIDSSTPLITSTYDEVG